MNATPEPCLAVPVGSDDHITGPDGAGITLVEYGDFECSYCAQAAPVVGELRRLFGDDLRFVFRNMPLTELHPHAERAAEAAEAAALPTHPSAVARVMTGTDHKALQLLTETCVRSPSPN
jgi:protein-disulfide isomerase